MFKGETRIIEKLGITIHVEQVFQDKNFVINKISLLPGTKGNKKSNQTYYHISFLKFDYIP